MTSRAELIDLIASTAVAALNWHWDEAPSVPSPEATFRHVAEAIADALRPKLGDVWDESRRDAADVLGFRYRPGATSPNRYRDRWPS